MAEAVGNADPASLDAGAGFFVKQQAAKTAALANLKQQVLSLPVTSENDLAQIVASNLSVRRAVERQLQTAEVVSQQQGMWMFLFPASNPPLGGGKGLLLAGILLLAAALAGKIIGRDSTPAPSGEVETENTASPPSA